MANPSPQSFDRREVRSAAILTGSYVAGTTLKNLESFNQLVLFIDFTKGSLTTAEVKVEFSDDGETFYQEVSESFSGGTGTVDLAEHQLDETGKFRLALPIKCSAVKVSAKGTGTVTGSSMAITAVVGVQ